METFDVSNLYIWGIVFLRIDSCDERKRERERRYLWFLAYISFQRIQYITIRGEVRAFD